MTGVAPPAYRNVRQCRVCTSTSFSSLLKLGRFPLANSFISSGDGGAPEETYPLELMRCSDCGLLQLSVVVSPEKLFRNYLYASSASSPLIEHFDSYAADVSERFAPAGSLVVEIGSNDGVLLRPLAARGIRIVGIEPAMNLARLASDAGLETWNEFFGPDVARRVASRKGRAAVVVANNVLAHIDDLSEVLQGLDALLDGDGVLIAEVPYLADLVENVEYDTIYHEHLSYFALGTLARLAEQGGLELFEVRRLSIHGGSIRVFAGRKGRHAVTSALRVAEDGERRLGLDRAETYERFAERVSGSRQALRALISELRGRGKRVAALGATAKGNTLLNYCGFRPTDIEFIADSTPLKQGLLAPGSRIPVRPERCILDERPDYTLLLAWNYADTLLQRFREYVAGGGRFIHPIPVAHLLP